MEAKLLHIDNKKDCCGCRACAMICPVQCITFAVDEEGFWYPQTDVAKCVDCGRCDNVCPVKNRFPVIAPIATFAAKHKDVNTQKQSSSGAVFLSLAENIIKNNGVVIGVRWSADFMTAEFDVGEKLEDVKLFSGSKYLQAETGNIYHRCQEYLMRGKTVLFSGTSCQVAGLKHFLGKDYENLITVELICHGVPSPVIWKKYLKALMLKSDMKTLTSVNFRDKREGGQKCFHLYISGNTEKSVSKVFSQKFADDLYGRAFLQNLSLRPSCYYCPAKKRQSGADLTIGDFWGIEQHYPQLDDSNGVSLIVANSTKGRVIVESLETLAIFPVEYAKGFSGNIGLEYSVKLPDKRNIFWKNVCNSETDICQILYSATKPTLLQDIRKIIVKILFVCGMLSFVKQMREKFR